MAKVIIGQASLRDLLIAAAAMAVVAVRQGTYRSAAWVADAVLEDHLAEQAEPVAEPDDSGNPSY